MEENNEAWKMLIASLDDKDAQIISLKKREIELLQKLMKSEENTKGLIQVIAEMQLSKKESPKIN